MRFQDEAENKSSKMNSEETDDVEKRTIYFDIDRGTEKISSDDLRNNE